MQRLEFFRQQAPEFNNLNDDAVQAQFTTASAFYSKTLENLKEGDKKELAIALLAAHLCWLQKYPGQGGAHRGVLTLEKDDKLQRNYQSVQGADTWLGQSHYGLSFSNLLNIGAGKHRPAIFTRFGV